ncbi:MAG: EAL domain-containing protein [Myxococcota bacterium]|nr:EAL domain-containing protein [Myxococcota bacterium]
MTRRPPSSHTLRTLRKQTLTFPVGSTERETSTSLLHDDEARKRYAFLVNTSVDWMASIDRTRRYDAVNDAFCEATGLERADAVGSAVGAVWDPAVRERVRANVERAFSKEHVEDEMWVWRPDGRRAFVRATWVPYVRSGTTRLVVETVRDETERAEATERRVAYERQLRAALVASEAANAAESLAEAARAAAGALVDVLGARYVRIWTVDDEARELCARGAPEHRPFSRPTLDLEGARSAHGPGGAQVVVPARDGERRVAVIEAVFDATAERAEELSHVVEQIAAQLGLVDGRLRAQAESREKMFRDELTELPNRSGLRRLLVEARARGTDAGVLHVDVDRFKRINDGLGHAAGDHILIEIAARLAECTPTGAGVARVGGDEFAVVIEGDDIPARAREVAQRVRESLRAPFLIGARRVYLDASIGLALGEGPPEHLLRDADLASHRAKKQRTRATMQLFERDMLQDAVIQLGLETALREALASEDDGVSVALQPVFDLRDDDRVVGFEALARWSPAGASIPPSQFIPVAEETGLIVELGDRVMQRSLAALATLRAAWGREDLTVAVNVSGAQLRVESFPARVAQLVAESGLEPAALKIEVTESLLLEESIALREALEAIRRLGVQICLDDFGTGYSSLSYLQRFPFDVLKIDQAFIREAAETGDDAILRAVIAVADALGMSTVAEGLETDADRERLGRLGCALGQGYVVSRPLTLEEAIERRS